MSDTDHALRTAVEAAIADHRDPTLDIDLMDRGLVHEVAVEGGRVSVSLMLGFPAERFGARLAEGLRRRLAELSDQVTVSVDWSVAPSRVQGSLQPMPGISNIIAVASGKGGVGKSTTAVNLALALAGEGARVGILDADIYGPSQPRMLGLRGERPTAGADGKVRPLQAHGVLAMSAGFLVDEETPMIWRGPMVTQALTQLLTDTEWGELDYLIVDMPPGTGDTQLTLAQQVPVAGAVIVTTPQDIALLDARKGLRMFEKVEVTVLGIVENMSTHVCSSCGHEEPIFGAGGGLRLSEETGAPFLGGLPLDLSVREQADGGAPTVVSDPDGPIARAYTDIALRATAALSLVDARGAGFPDIEVVDD